MTTITQFSAKAASVAAGIALVAGFATPTFADTPAGCTFYRDLTVGVQGADVVCLQSYLIRSGFSIPAGATGYFGSQTQAATAAWQAAHGVYPPAGYFGPLSRAEYLTLIGSGTGGGGGGGGGTGRATLSNFNLIDRGVNVKENDENDEIATANFTVANANANVNRMDLEFRAESSSESARPWDYIRSVAVYNGSTRIGSVSADSASDWSRNGGTDSRPVYLISVDLSATLIAGRAANLDVKVTSLSTINNQNNGQTFDVDVPDQGIHATDSLNDQLRTGDGSDMITFDITGGNGNTNVKGTGDTAVVTSNGEHSYGTFTLKFDVTARGSDAYIPESMSSDSNSNAGVVYAPNMDANTAGANIAANLSSSADTNSGYFVVHEGDTEHFTASVIIDPTSADYYQVGLSKIHFALRVGGGLSELNLNQNDSQYHTDPIYIPNS